jgi:uncharacterized membrane protein
MAVGLGMKSILLFVLSCIFLLVLTLFESLLSGLSLTTERIITALLLILPGLAGIIFGAMSVKRKESPRAVAILGIVLNGAFVLFHVFLLSFAG